MVYILTLMLFILVVTNYRISRREIFNPAFVVTGMFFLFSILCCFANISIGIDLNDSFTIFVIITGMMMFTVCNYCQPVKINRHNVMNYNFKVDNVCAMMAAVALILTIYVNYKYIIDFAASYGIGGDFFECLVQYKLIMTFSDASEILVQAPWYRRPLMILSTVFAYLFMYLFFRDKFIYKKIRYIYFFIIILYIIFSLMGGGRSETFRIITAMLFLWGWFKENEDTHSFKPSIMIAKILTIVGIVAALFVLFVVAVGRTTSDFDVEYIIQSIFVYAAAPIFNLDIYLENPWKQTYGIWGEMTFVRTINWLGVHLNISKWQYALDLPFMSYHEYNLGNVYTTFYPFYYDFGFIGVVVLSIIMAVISFWVYRKMRAGSDDEMGNILWGTAYAFLINDLIMLPFSGRFYETLFSFGVWYNIISFVCMVMCIRYFKSAK